MKITSEPMPGLKVLSPTVFGDIRGYFLESYNQKNFSDLGINDLFIQDNLSLSAYGTIRGLHFQMGPFAQSKLVTVLKGRILDVVVDLRSDSKTFKKSFLCELSEENKMLIYIPRGFAHGFAVLSESALFSYKCDNFYSPANEGGLRYNDPDLSIDWGIQESKLVVSTKDLNLPFMKDLKL